MDNILEIRAAERPEGTSLLALYRTDKFLLRCRTCRKQHFFVPASDEHRGQMFMDWHFKHPVSRGCLPVMLKPDDVARLAMREERRRRGFHLSNRYAGNANVNEAFQGADQSLTITALNSLASSATAGWGSGNIDNSANLYLDYLWALTLAAVNTAPGNDKCFYIFAATALNTTDLPNNGAAAIATTQAALTFPSISTLPTAFPQVGPVGGVVPYPVQNVAIQASCLTAWAFKGAIGLQLWYALLNFSGMTIAASSNAWKYRGLFLSVV